MKSVAFAVIASLLAPSISVAAQGTSQATSESPDHFSMAEGVTFKLGDRAALSLTGRALRSRVRNKGLRLESLDGSLHTRLWGSTGS